jgi:glycosyltransferase involved in cell wall biosynthesis
MADNLRIAIASWAPFHAGAEIAAERLALGLQAEGHEVMVVLGTDGETLRRMRQAGLQCEFLPLMLTNKWQMWRWAAVQRELVRVLHRFQPDVVHCNDLPTNQMVGKAAGQLGVPRICHHRFPFGATAINWLNKFGAQRHLFVSAALKNEMCTASLSLAAAPCEVVHDGLPLETAPDRAARTAARLELNLAADKTLVLFAGQLIERKGVADLLNAWQLLPPLVRDRAELLIVGDDLQNGGAYRLEMQQLANRLGSPAKFFGFQRNIGLWLTAADVAVVPSHVEPLGNATLEAMAQALPVIGCDVGGIPEMIVNEETGLLVPPHQPGAIAVALERLINHPAERETFGDAGRARCELHFDIAVHARAILHQYRLVLSEPKACLAS